MPTLGTADGPDEPSTSTQRRSRPQKRRPSSEVTAFEEEVLSILKSSTTAASCSDHEEYGKFFCNSLKSLWVSLNFTYFLGRLVIKMLDRLKDTPAYPQFLKKLTQWIVECQCYKPENEDSE